MGVRRARLLLPVVLLSVAALVAAVLLAGGPGRASARQLVEDYLEARIASGCAHYAYYSEELARAEHVDVKQCQADEAIAEGEYFEYSIEDVRARGARAEVDVEDESDAPRGPFTVVLTAEDGQWRITAIEEHEE